MEKDVIISIKGVQRYENADPDTMELVTAGRLEREGNSYTLSYQESELTGLEGTLTTFQIEPERITLMRVGEFNSQMVFQEGRRHISMYNTPYGASGSRLFFRRGRTLAGPREGHTPGWLLSAFGRFTFSPSPTVVKKAFRV